jgi:F0F1-type ATP synthase delta subunit
MYTPRNANLFNAAVLSIVAGLGAGLVHKDDMDRLPEACEAFAKHIDECNEDEGTILVAVQITSAQALHNPLLAASNIQETIALFDRHLAVSKRIAASLAHPAIDPEEKEPTPSVETKPPAIDTDNRQPVV